MILADYRDQPTEIDPTEEDFQEAEKLARLWAEGKLPQTTVEPDSAFIGRRYNETITPDEMSVHECKLFNANPLDYDWYVKHFKDLPSYLTRYFVSRYIAIFEKKGRHAANTFLREKMSPANARVRMVMSKYLKLPDTTKITLLKEQDVIEQSVLAAPSSQQLTLNLDQTETGSGPSKHRILAELEVDELKDMACILANAVIRQQAESSTCTKYETEDAEYIALLMICKESIALIHKFGLVPPVALDKVTPENVVQAISKMRDEKWWLGKLKRVRKLMREHLAIAMGQVSSKASAYCSWDCVKEHQSQQKKNWEAIKNLMLWDELTDEEIDLADMVLKSQANPAIRRHELMVRTRGCEDIGNAMGLQGLFLTLTAPSKYHNHYKRGGFVGHWNGASPADTQRYLNHIWQLIRTKLGNEGLRWFGVRVAEPHHDGTPHWHLLIWVKPEEVSAIRDIFISYATREDRAELHPEYEREKQKPFRKCDYVGPMDYRIRCDVGLIDPDKGSATGYIAKYISKNIDGYAMDDEVSDETGKPVKEMAKHVSAWKSRWNLRQFQFFGGAPVTTYRELRRYANLDKASYLNYLTMLKRDQLLNIYDELEVKTGRKLAGPPMPVELIRQNKKYDAKYIFVLLSHAYQPSIESENGDVVKAMQGADIGNWQDYIMGQGGPFVKRTDLLIRNVYETLPFASPHGEDVKKIKGFEAFGEEYKTRTRVWSIVPKSGAKPEHKKEVTYEFDKPSEDPATWKFKQRVVTLKKNDDADAIAPGSEATDFGGSAASRSSVNNCTEPPPEQVTNKVLRDLDPMVEQEIKRLILEYELDDSFGDELISGKWLILDQNEENTKSIKLRLGDGQRLPDSLVYRNAPKEKAPDLSWLGEGWQEAVFDQPEDEEYEQPDMSLL